MAEKWRHHTSHRAAAKRETRNALTLPCRTGSAKCSFILKLPNDSDERNLFSEEAPHSVKSALLILFLLAVAGYLYLQRKPSARPLPATVPGTEISADPAKPEAMPAPLPIPEARTGEQATPNAPQLRLAPEGTFFALQRISIVNDAGVASITPGTKVTVIRPGPPLRVTDGKNEFEVGPEQVTNDLDVAGRVFQAFAQQQSQIAAVRQAAQPAPDAQAMERARQYMAKGEADTRRAQAIMELRSRLGPVARKEAAAEKVVAEVRNAFNSSGRITYNGKHPGLHELVMAENDFQRYSGERREIENKITDLQKSP